MGLECRLETRDDLFLVIFVTVYIRLGVLFKNAIFRYYELWKTVPDFNLRIQLQSYRFRKHFSRIIKWPETKDG